MGSCASVHKDTVSPTTKKAFLASTPSSKEKAVAGGTPVGDVLIDLKRKIEGQPGFGPKTPDYGSKDEMFFESQAWLDSDCEDDFLSVNGDFTPSRGTTPNHQPRIQTVMSDVFVPYNVHDTKSSEPSPTGRRKLAELFQEAMQNGHEESTITNGETDSSKIGQGMPQLIAAAGKPESKPSSVSSTEPTPIREARIRKEKAWYMGRCCLPTFVHSLTLDDQRRQKMSPSPCDV